MKPERPRASSSPSARETVRPLRTGGAYTVDKRHVATTPRVDEETTDVQEVYARFGATARTRYREGWLTG
jgi:hypothetical protein